MPKNSLTLLRRYGIALLAVALATASQLALDRLLGGRFPFLAFFVAIGLTTWYGGLGPSLLAIALSWLAADHFLLQPRGPGPIFSDKSQIIFPFFTIGLTITLLSEAVRDARLRARASAIEARRALIAQQAQQEWLRITLASIADAVITTDSEGCVNSLNPAAERLTGCGGPEAAGRRLTEVFRTTEGTIDGTAHFPVAGVVGGEAVLSGHQTVLIECDGATKYVEHNASPIRDDRGVITGVVIVLRDITQRRQAEQALRESEARFRRLADTMPQIVWTAAPDGSVDYFNARWYEYTGMTPEASMLEGWRTAVHPDDLARLSLLRGQAVAGSGVFDIEVRLRHREGAYRWHLLRSVPVPDEPGRADRRFGAATDIDDRKQAEEALRRSEQCFARFMQHLPGLAWIKDSQGRYVYANAAAEQAFGTPQEDLYGKTDDEIFSPETAVRIGAHDRKALDGESGVVVIEDLKQEDGERNRSLVSKFPIPGPDGQVALVGGMAIDITDRMRAEEALKEADRRKDEFLATLAHELRNPLAPIRNALHLMKHRDGGDQDIEAERAMAERQVAHLARLVDDLMDLARISRGRIELRKEPLELAPAVRQAVEAVQSTIEGRGHALIVSLPAEPIRLEADPTRLEQVIWNLLSNAAKYTEPGGQVRLTALREGGEVVLRVRDTGIGIESDMLPRVFGMFAQADHRSGRTQGGLGIGLSLVKTLVEMHGGTIEAHSQGPGTGSEFVVRLPVLPGAVEQRVEPKRDEPVRAAAAPPRRRILVVDDNVDAATSLARLLSRLMGQEVRVAHDGPSALEVAEEFRPDLVLLDIGMPGMDGHEVARRLRGRPEFERTLLVALTGWGQEQDRKKSSESGIDCHLVKPVDPAALGALLAGPDRATEGCGPAPPTDYPAVRLGG